jgi:GT2 family glycosyltransferase
MIDIVTVIHNDKNELLAADLYKQISKFETDFTFFIHSNKEDNLGFAKGCNLGAFRDDAKSDIIAFINPDVSVRGPFIKLITETLSDPNVVITGNRFRKPSAELKIWGVSDWVCGATFFVKRDWFESVGGFDENYVWSWEETDLIRQAESQGLIVKSINITTLHHASPDDDSRQDSLYKKTNFAKGQKYYFSKWGK